MSMGNSKTAVKPSGYKTTHISTKIHLQLVDEANEYYRKTKNKISIREIVDRKLAVPFKG